MVEHLQGMFKPIPEMWQRPICRDLCTLSQSWITKSCCNICTCLINCGSTDDVSVFSFVFFYKAFNLDPNIDSDWFWPSSADPGPLKLQFGALIWISTCTHEGWWLHWTHAVNTDAKRTGAMKENLCAIYIGPHSSLQSSRAVMHCKNDWLVRYWEIVC